MKQIISCFLCLALLFSLTACSAGTNKIEKPILFYYTVAATDKQAQDSFIEPETRESAGYENKPDKLIDLYLRGPVDAKYTSPFPKDTILVSSNRDYDTLYLRLSNRISRLSGIDLFVACACLTLTAAEITGAKEVVISSESGTMDGMAQITMNASSIHMRDYSASYPSQPATLPPTDSTANSKP